MGENPSPNFLRSSFFWTERLIDETIQKPIITIAIIRSDLPVEYSSVSFFFLAIEHTITGLTGDHNTITPSKEIAVFYDLELFYNVKRLRAPGNRTPLYSDLDL